jgi:hypothetical protein
MILEQYLPKRFGREYVGIKASQQYPMFVATALGLKASFDDWVDVSRYDEFVEMCRKYKLYVERDLIFDGISDDKKSIIGGNNITTTFVAGKRFKEGETGRVHVFVSLSKEKALEAKKTGWYNVVINNRSINKPFIDHLRFGIALGFPDCCVDFFRRFNDWNKYSHPLETLRNTPKLPGRAKGSYYCNNFLMDNTFFFIHNLPCSYRCEKTIEYAKKLEAKFLEIEPEFAEKAVELLKKPLLVFGERNFVLFDGAYSDEEIKYRDCYYNRNPARLEESVGFFGDIMGGNRLRFEGNKLDIFKDDKLLRSVERKKQWFLMDWD